MTPGQLTIRIAQQHQPWTVPYTPEVAVSTDRKGAHAVLHGIKSLGKLADVFEYHDHCGLPLAAGDLNTIRNMSADLMTIALRFANLYRFDLAESLLERTLVKNGRTCLDGLDKLESLEAPHVG